MKTAARFGCSLFRGGQRVAQHSWQHSKDLLHEQNGLFSIFLARTVSPALHMRSVRHCSHVTAESIHERSKLACIRGFPPQISQQSGQQNTMSAQDNTKLRDQYPASEPYDSGWLQVSDIHRIHYMQFGKKDGNPVIFLHGGPGAGIDERDHRFFNPDAYRIVLFDQRGAGKSTPPAELRENTTWDLVEDVEKLRKHLGIDQWVVFGGSWGSTMALAYAETHPSRVKAVVIRGIFNVRRQELEWLYEDKGGACMLFPDHFEHYRDFIPPGERKDIISAYYRRLTGEDVQMRVEAAKSWSRWEMAISSLLLDERLMQYAEDDEWALQYARIGCHYFVHGGFMETDTQLLDNIDKIRHIPATIVQGRYDVACPVETAWLLHKHWPEAEFHIVPDAGHSSMEPGTMSLLVQATDKYKDL